MRSITLILLAAVIASCGEHLIAPLAEPAEYQGVVGRITMDSDSSGVMFMSEMRYQLRPSGPSAPHEGLVRLGRSPLWHDGVVTRIFVQRVDTLLEASIAAIKPGQNVKIWTTGVELRSLPPQYVGRQIVILESP